MHILHIAVGAPQPEVTALLQHELRLYADGEMAELTADSGALLRKALCVNAKPFDLVLLTGTASLCREVAVSLINDAQPQSLDVPGSPLSGWIYPRFGRFWAWLPSEPALLTALLHERLLPQVCAEKSDRPAAHTVGIYGLPAELLRERLAPLLEANEPQASLYPFGEEWRLHLTVSSGEKTALEAAVETARELLGQYVYGVDCADLATRVAQLLTEKKLEAAAAGNVEKLVKELLAAGASIVTADIKPSADDGVPPIRETVKEARTAGQARLGLALLEDGDASRPTVRLALADDKRVWYKTLTGAQRDTVLRQAHAALLDLLRRYLEALPAVIAGGELLAAVDEVSAIPVTPLQKEQPVLFRRTKSRSEKVFKTCLIVLLILLVLAPVLIIGYFHLRVPEDIDTFRELEDLYQGQITDTDVSGYPPGMLPPFYALYNENTDIRGWIRLDAGKSYPVMSGRGEIDYSQTGFYRQPSVYGVPYFFPALPAAAGNRCLIIYGNNTKDGEMFSSLVDYLDAHYVRSHATIEMNTLYENGMWQVFAVAVMDDGDDSFNYTRTAFTDEADFAAFVDALRERSRFDISTEVAAGDDLLLLTTEFVEEETAQNERILVAFRRVNGAADVGIGVTSKTTAATQSSSASQESSYPQLGMPESSDENEASSDGSELPEESSQPESSANEPFEESSEDDREDGGTEFIEPDEDEEPEEPLTVTTTATTTTTTTSQSPTTTTTTTTVTTTETTTTATATTTMTTTSTATTASAAPSETTDATVTTATDATGSDTTDTASSTATSSSAESTVTTTTTTTTTIPVAYTPKIKEGKIAESEYYSLFRLKNTKTGETFVPTTREELQLGVFYLVKRELGAGSTMKYSTEAQKAQAVASYTFVLYYCSNNNDPSKSSYYYSFAFDSYNPNNKNDQKLYAAVGEVLGIKMIYPDKAIKSQVINAMYSCSSSGVSSTCNKVYTGNLPYLVSVPSPYDTDAYIEKYSNGSDNLTRSFTITYAELLKGLADELDIAAAEIEAEDEGDMPVYARSWDGGEGYYVYETNLYYYKSGKKTYIRGKDVRDAIKDDTDMRSHAFEVTAYDKKTDTLTITTKGYGHGLGLSQYGAVGFANEAGWTYDQILAHYYSITDSTSYQLVAPKW